MYKKIKRLKGERFARTLRDHHNGILELPSLDTIIRHAGQHAAPLLSYLTNLLTAHNPTLHNAGMHSPFALLKAAGYDAFYADTLEKQNSIIDYFEKHERLCTFSFNNTARHVDFHIIHAIHHDAQSLKRSDFTGKESRQDAYGTSVISIQMAKEGGFIKITNRYNHSITNPDNTFNANPDNIIPGLSAALMHHFNVNFQSTDTLPDDYTVLGNQIFKYHSELNNIYYGHNAWLQNTVIHATNKSAGDALFGHYLFNNKSKTLSCVDPHNHDNFPNIFNALYGGNTQLCVRSGNLVLNDTILLGAQNSKLIHLNLPGLQYLGSNALLNLNHLETLNLPDLIKVDNASCTHLHQVTQLNIPELDFIGNDSFIDAHSLIALNAPKLKRMGNSCFRGPNSLKHIHLPALKNMHNDCFKSVRQLETLSLPSLRNMGQRCFQVATSLKEINIDSLTSTGAECFTHLEEMESLSAPSLSILSDLCFTYAHKLTDVNLPLLGTMGGACFSRSPRQKQIQNKAYKNVLSHKPLRLRMA